MLLIENLVKEYGNFRAVDGLTMKINDGEFFGLLGPNGAGKTTTIRMISSITPKTKGKIIIDNINIDRNMSELKKKIGVVPQHNNLEPEMTTWENLELHGRLYGVSKSKRGDRIEELLHFIDLLDRKNNVVKTFSGGMKRKLMIARALLHEPDIILLDEPTVGLDPMSRRKMWDLLKQLKSKGITVLLTTHYIEEAEALCDRVGLMNSGKLIKADSPENFINNLGRFAVDYFEVGVTRSLFFKTREEAIEMTGKLTGTVNFRPSSLEDVFINITCRKAGEK